MTDNRPFRDKPLLARRALFRPWRLTQQRLEEILLRQNLDLSRLTPLDELKLADLNTLREVLEVSLQFRESFGDVVGRDVEQLEVHSCFEGDGVLDMAVANAQPSVVSLLTSDPIDDDYLKAQARASFLAAKARVAANPLAKHPKRLSTNYRSKLPPTEPAELVAAQERRLRAWKAVSRVFDAATERDCMSSRELAKSKPPDDVRILGWRRRERVHGAIVVAVRGASSDEHAYRVARDHYVKRGLELPEPDSTA